MIYKEDEYKLMPYLATYEQHGETHEQYVVDKSELEAFEQMGHISKLSFEKEEYDEGTLARLEEVKDYPEEDFQIVQDYVLENKVREGSPLDLKKKNESLELTILELSMMLGGGV